MKHIVVAGIGTEVGKTFISAILVEALQADYWKPVQAGGLEWTDTDTVRSLVSNPKSFFHPEAYRLTAPMSPHAAARIDGVEIDPGKLMLPSTENILITELAGGLMVPLNDGYLNLDLIKRWKAGVVLVSRNYLGSINHTLLSIEVLKRHNVELLGLVFNDARNPSTEDFILNYTGVHCLARMEREAEMNKDTVRRYASQIKI